MKIIGDIQAIEPFPAIFIETLGIIAIADLHLGYEVLSSEHGVFVPRVQFKKTIETMENIVRKVKADRILILGDLKHEFSETTYHEYQEVSSFLRFLIDKFDEIILVRGNHDTFITRITKKFGVSVYDEYTEDNYLFLHGHKEKNLKKISQSTIVMGHEHPSLALYTDIGVKEKIKCFMYGKAMGKNILVLPAFSFFAQGSDVNLIPASEFLSPLLRDVDIDGFETIGIIENDRYLRFPEIGKLRRLYE